MKVVEILSAGVLVKVNGYTVKLGFYPNSYDMTHDLEVDRGRWHTQVYLSGQDCQKVLDKLNAGGVEAGEMWTVLRLIKALSYRVKRDRIRDFLYQNDLDAILKSVWYSMNSRKYGIDLRADMRILVRNLFRYKKITKENKWAKKILNIEKRIFWKRVLTDEWE